MAMLRSLLLLFFIFSMGNAEINLVERCPYGWTNFGVRCYKFFPETVNWITAERNCQSVGANLASAHSKAENDFLSSLLPTTTTRSWLGAHDGEQEGQWAWTDGTPYDFTNWGSGEPNNGGVGNCVEFNWASSNQWFDAACSTSLGSICVTDL